jgi:6-phosphogluconolactonase (cycloisomerase 2 family)
MSQDRSGDGEGAVYVQTNDSDRNEIIAYRRAIDGRLIPLGIYNSGGLGLGKPHLASQSSVALSRDGRWLFAVNAGSDELSVFAVGTDGLRFFDRVGAGGARSTSVAVQEGLLYLLSTGGGADPASLHGFRISDDGGVSPLEGSSRELSRPDADPAQIGFSPDGGTLVVTERATDSISAYVVGEDGFAEGPTVFPSAGATPYGFDFTRAGVMVVTEAAGGKTGAASASSYSLSGPGKLSLVSGSVGDTRSEVCWAAISPDDRYVYVTNFGDGTISTYTISGDGRIELLDAVAATTVEGQKGIRDEAVSRDGRYLYALHADVQKVFGWEVRGDGSLRPVGAFGDLPATVAGIAAS